MTLAACFSLHWQCPTCGPDRGDRNDSSWDDLHGCYHTQRSASAPDDRLVQLGPAWALQGCRHRGPRPKHYHQPRPAGLKIFEPARIIESSHESGASRGR